MTNSTDIAKSLAALGHEARLGVFRLLVKAAKGAPLQEALTRWLAPVRLKGDLRLAVDIDPQSFL